jgi:hypothetical protein
MLAIDLALSKLYGCMAIVLIDGIIKFSDSFKSSGIGLTNTNCPNGD